MAFYPGLAPLRDVLAGLYPSKNIAQVVVAEAGLPEQLIDFEGAAVVFWKNILSVAQSNNQINELIDVARKHFPMNRDLIMAKEAYVSIPSPSDGYVNDDRNSVTKPQRDDTVAGDKITIGSVNGTGVAIGRKATTNVQTILSETSNDPDSEH